MSSYSLWFVPDSAVLSYYRDIIVKLSNKFQSAAFLPHVTLLGNIEGQPLETILEKTAHLADKLKPLRLEIDGIGYEDFFFRSLYFRVRLTGALLAANQLAQECFYLEDPAPYMPHLSLLYSNLPASEKRGLIPSLARDPQGYFIPENISLWETRGDISKWHLVKEFPL
ncbi:MAG: 2'-5' RNA ligase family protein [Candidatus Sungbacteria bacterium]|uniref:2'-5' RNA ligase family protein n=1 Tax=Candidatus Sungiibacteriota bacterium TaxID=2750080 RepID=A0A931WPB0_9BACT|nr:2'-5' RNA ligase family protein [Candidatus Sungbacteria bacterium]